MKAKQRPAGGDKGRGDNWTRCSTFRRATRRFRRMARKYADYPDPFAEFISCFDDSKPKPQDPR